MNDEQSGAKALSGYSFLVVFGNDDRISSGELAMLEKIALRDGTVDEHERAVLRNVFERANKEKMSADTLAEIDAFRRKFGV